MNSRRLISLTTMSAFLLLVFTGAVLYVVPHGRIAYWSDWHWLGLSKTQWGDLHVTGGVFFCIAGIWHAFFNGKAIIRYLKARQHSSTVVSTELIASLCLIVLVCVGTCLNWPPFCWIADLGEHVKEVASERYGEPPYGHAERSSLEVLAVRMRLDLQEAVNSLRDAHITFRDETDTLGGIARNNDMSPSAVFKIIMEGEAVVDPTNQIDSGGRPHRRAARTSADDHI